MQRIVIVQLYGQDPYKTALGPYLNRVAKFIDEWRPDHVICCGGPTEQKTYGGRSEADAAYVYLYPRLAFVQFQGWADRKSLTTLENVQGGVRILRKIPVSNWQDVEVVVFCEAQRALKTLVLYWFLLPEIRKNADGKDTGRRIKLETDSWELDNPIKELFKIVLDIIAIHVPAVARWQHRKRLKRAASL